MFEIPTNYNLISGPISILLPNFNFQNSQVQILLQCEPQEMERQMKKSREFGRKSVHSRFHTVSSGMIQCKGVL